MERRLNPRHRRFFLKGGQPPVMLLDVENEKAVVDYKSSIPEDDDCRRIMDWFGIDFSHIEDRKMRLNLIDLAQGFIRTFAQSWVLMINEDDYLFEAQDLEKEFLRMAVHLGFIEAEVANVKNMPVRANKDYHEA